MSLKVTASDGNLSASDTFNLTVNAVTVIREVITGTNSSQLIVGSDLPNEIDGLGGNDTIFAYKGNGTSGIGRNATAPTIDPNGGNANDEDLIRGGRGNDAMYGGAGDDTFLVAGTSDGFDTFFGDSGVDTVVAETAGTTIGVNGYNNGVDKFQGHSSGDTKILDTNSSHTLDFSTTELVGISEINANGGNDSVIASNLSEMKVRGGLGNDSLSAGSQAVTWLYDGTKNGFDQFTNGAGNAIARAQSDGTVIGVNGYGNGVDSFNASGFANVVIQDTNSSHTLDFSTTELVGISEINANGGNDSVIGSSDRDIIMGGAGNDTIAGGAGADELTGNNGRDTFIYANLKDSVLDNYDKITGLVIGTDRVDGPNALTAAEVVQLGSVSELTASNIQALLSEANFTAGKAATFTFGTRTFLAINNGIAGYSATDDSLIELTGFSGNLGNLAII